jgi:8-oxo-dGTP pyrophosphatase MutT (NUDIX family)
VVYRLPDDGDTKNRAICTACHTVHYENPLNVVGTIPVWTDANTTKVLLCKRNIEPRKGLWTLPAGFLELGETTAEGAARETDEEAGAQIELQSVHFFYRARLLSDVFNPGYETMEAQLFTEAQIPWDDIAFRTVRDTLERYFADARTGQFQTHHFDI